MRYPVFAINGAKSIVYHLNEAANFGGCKIKSGIVLGENWRIVQLK